MKISGSQEIEKIIFSLSEILPNSDTINSAA